MRFLQTQKNNVNENSTFSNRAKESSKDAATPKSQDPINYQNENVANGKSSAGYNHLIKKIQVSKEKQQEITSINSSCFLNTAKSHSDNNNTVNTMTSNHNLSIADQTIYHSSVYRDIM